MYGICSFASQLFVSEAATSNMRHDTMKAFAIMCCFAVVVAEYLFVQIAEHMERLYRNVRAFQSALQKAPEVFETVGMNLSINVLFGVVNRLVNEVLIVESLIGEKRIRVDRALGFDMSANLRLQVMSAAIWHDRRSNLSAAFQHAHHSQFVFHSTFGDYPLSPSLVHETGRATDESLVHFDFLSLSTYRNGLFGMHGKTDAVHHVPSGLLRDAQSASDYVGANSVLAVRQHPHGNHPLVHAERRILKNSAHLDRELLLAGLAEPDAPRRDKGMLFAFAAWARNVAIRPAQLDRVVEGLLRVAKEHYRLLQGLGQFERVFHDA